MKKHGCFLFLLACFYISSAKAADVNQGCVYSKHNSDSPVKKKGEDQLEVLRGRRFKAEDKEFTYDVGICVDALSPLPEDGERFRGAGVVQISKTDNTKHIVGKYAVADIYAGPEWVLLEYNGGDPYTTHCLGPDGKVAEHRRARIMFVCDMSAPEEEVILLEEQNNKTDSCHYLFEIGTASVCPKQPLITFGLSVGSVLLIVFFSVLIIYLLGGCAYNRFIRGAKGLEQMPNQKFWEDFGNLQADGCDLVCRSKRSKQPKTYKGIGDDQLAQDTDERIDDHLLPM